MSHDTTARKIRDGDALSNDGGGAVLGLAWTDEARRHGRSK